MEKCRDEIAQHCNDMEICLYFNANGKLFNRPILNITVLLSPTSSSLTM